MPLDKLPDYDQLAPAPHGGRSGWGVFGSDDSIGLLNLLTPERVLAASKLVRQGKVFALNAEVDAFSPAISSPRGLPQRREIHRDGTIYFDDAYDNFNPQGSSQWDSLGHVGYSVNAFYNGATEEDVATGRRNTIDHWARRGIAGRGVVLDMVRTLTDVGRSYDPGSSVGFSVSDLELARHRAGMDFGPGDIMILHTGFSSWYRDQPLSVRAALAEHTTTPGLQSGEEMCRYLWNLQISSVVSDTFAVEVTPLDLEAADATGFLHRMLIGQFGMALGELWWTEELANDCAIDGVYEVFIVSAPMNVRGGVGSPSNALAIK